MLYVVATPIGNLDDITLRALKTLENADLIAAEDTRHTMGLLSHFGIRKPLVSYYEHNKAERGPELIEKLRGGAEIALVSDAGLPGICDPGYELIKECIDNGIEVTVVPGACACVTALVLSGLPSSGFVFEGFAGRDKKSRAEFCGRVLNCKTTCVCYEAPHRLTKTLEALKETFDNAGTPDRQMAVIRELTKTHEEVLRGNAATLLDHFNAEPPRGEFVICIEGASGDPAPAGGSAACPENTSDPEGTKENIKKVYNEIIAGGTVPKEALKTVAVRSGIARNEAYKIIHGEGRS